MSLVELRNEVQRFVPSGGVPEQHDNDDGVVSHLCLFPYETSSETEVAGAREKEWVWR